MTANSQSEKPMRSISGSDSGQPPNDQFARDLRGFGVVGILAIIAILAGNFLIPPLSALLAIAWAWRSHTPWRDIGFLRPRSWWVSSAIGILFGVAFKFAMKAIVMPLLGAPPINQAYHFLAGNRALVPYFLLQLIVIAGFGEETLFRGYMLERMGKLFGSSAAAKAAIILISSFLFAILHYRVQGIPGTEQAFIVGVVYGAIFATAGRLWMLMCAHAAFDLAAYAMIYWNFETAVAHLVFK